MCVSYMTCFPFIYVTEDDDDDGSESVASSATGSEEDSNHQLLTAPIGDVAFVKEKPVRLARELM
jgi:hypothetical protein